MLEHPFPRDVPQSPERFPSPVTRYRAALPTGTLQHFPVTAIDRIGVPAWSVTFWPESLPVAGGHGYGTTDDEALTSAYGELSEVVHASATLRQLPRHYASYRSLITERGSAGVVDPVTLSLNAGSHYTPDLELTWVPVRRYGSTESVLVPIEFVAIQPSDIEVQRRASPLVQPITNGLGAGPSLEHAIGHGLLELLQRDGNSVNFRALSRDTTVALDGVATAETRRLLEHLDAQGVEVLVKLASTDFGMPNLYVVGYDRDPRAGDPLMAAACGEAAHPDREIALRKALLEFCAARARLAFTHGPLRGVEHVAPPGYLSDYRRRYSPTGEEQRAFTAMLDWTSRSNGEIRAALEPTVFANRQTIPFTDLPTIDHPLVSRADLAATIVERLASAGFDILYADFSPAGHTGIHVVKAIVPGLEVETMSYYRIGARNLRRLLDRAAEPGQSHLRGIVGITGDGNRPETAQSILLTQAAQAQFDGQPWIDPAAIDLLVGPLYVLYREPGRHAVALAREQADG